jgi:hypothetical protein
LITIGNAVKPSQVTLEGERTETEDGTNFAFSNQLSTISSNSDDLLGGIFINTRDRISALVKWVEFPLVNQIYLEQLHHLKQ